MIQSIAKKALSAALALCSVAAYAGNKDRSGQAGAAELLINPWAATTGVFGANTATVTGVEAMKGNIAGLAFTDKFDIAVSHNTYLKGSNVSILDLGFGIRLGNAGVLGVNAMAVNYGEIAVTNYNHPYGQEIGTYKPSIFNIQFGFAKEFSHSIHAGVGGTFVSEKITNAGAMGAAFEAGVQYVTGLMDNFHFGVTLRNVGTNMKFTGPGFTFDSETQSGYEIARQTPSQQFEMPTYLNIAAAYDFYLDQKKLAKEDDKPKHRLTLMAGFTSNSFNNDYIHGGLEYSYRDMVMLRAGYRYEKDIANDALSTTFYRGFAAGATVMTRLGENGPRVGIDYSFRPTHRPDNGVHAVSLRFMLSKKGKPAAEDNQ